MKLNMKILAQVIPAHVGIVHNGRRRALGQDMALMDDERAVDDLKGFSYVVIRNKHPDSPSGKLAHQLANITDRNGINPCKGLVEEDKLGIGGKARAISTRRRSPPESATDGECRIWAIENSSYNSRNLLVRLALSGS